MSRVRTDVSTAYKGIPITTSDSTILPDGIRAIYIGGSGNLSVQMAGDTAATTLVGVIAGSWLPLQVTKVLATGTTATNIVALL